MPERTGEAHNGTTVAKSYVTQQFNATSTARREPGQSVRVNKPHICHTRRRKQQLTSRQHFTGNSAAGRDCCQSSRRRSVPEDRGMSDVISILLALVIGALTSWPAHTQGQRFATFSSDLASVRGERVRVIVQSDERGLNDLAAKHRRGLRGRLATSVALERRQARARGAQARPVGPAHLARPAGGGRHGHHEQGHARRRRSGRARAGCSGSSADARLQRQRHRASRFSTRASPRTARSARAWSRASTSSRASPGVGGDPFGHGTHVAGMIGGSGAALASPRPTTAAAHRPYGSSMCGCSAGPASGTRARSSPASTG